MEEERAIALSGRSGEQGSALIIVLVAIVVLLPPTLILMTLSLRWQRQSLDFRDSIADEFHAEAEFEHARNRVASPELGLASGEARSFDASLETGARAAVRIERSADVVLTQNGEVLQGMAADEVDDTVTGVDAEGRTVYRFRRLEIYLVQVDVTRRPTLPATRLYGVLAKLPGGDVQTLGATVSRAFFEGRRGEPTHLVE